MHVSWTVAKAAWNSSARAVDSCVEIYDFREEGTFIGSEKVEREREKSLVNRTMEDIILAPSLFLN